ncbi:hypothetical protein BC829DRAFT_378357 [Chytridium lagenaria]|nr:hypothetical protein BC829DRAFT_378357 [Chytridium lagenaria]
MQIKNTLIAAVGLSLVATVLAQEAPAAVAPAVDAPAAEAPAGDADSLGAAIDAVGGAAANAVGAAAGAAGSLANAAGAVVGAAANAVTSAVTGNNLNCWVTGLAPSYTLSQSKDGSSLLNIGDTCQAAKAQSKTSSLLCSTTRSGVSSSLSLYSEVNCCSTDLCNNNAAGALGTNLLISAGVAVAISFYSFF